MKDVISKIQGIYYLVTGIWPVIHIQSFMAVTGPKTDIWLVKMVALLSVSIALTILLQKKHTNGFILNILTALSFLIIDLYYALSTVISPIYLTDAGIQLLFVILFILPFKGIRSFSNDV